VPTCLVVMVMPQHMHGCVLRAIDDDAPSASESEAVALVALW
jgi:hypothetical protein